MNYDFTECIQQTEEEIHNRGVDLDYMTMFADLPQQQTVEMRLTTERLELF